MRRKKNHEREVFGFTKVVMHETHKTKQNNRVLIPGRQNRNVLWVEIIELE